MKVPVVSTEPSPGEETFGHALLGGLVGGTVLTIALIWGPLLWIPAGEITAKLGAPHVSFTLPESPPSSLATQPGTNGRLFTRCSRCSVSFWVR